jgi:hypothetical protein
VGSLASADGTRKETNISREINIVIIRVNSGEQSSDYVIEASISEKMFNQYIR